MARPLEEEHCLHKKKRRGQAENRQSDKCGRLHRVTDLFGLLIAPPRHLAERKSMVSGEVDILRAETTYTESESLKYY